MTGIRERFLAENNGDTAKAAEALARGLMKGDAATFKAGYTADNAAIAAAEVFALDTEGVETLATSLDADVRLVKQVLGKAA